MEFDEKVIFHEDPEAHGSTVDSPEAGPIEPESEEQGSPTDAAPAEGKGAPAAEAGSGEPVSEAEAPASGYEEISPKKWYIIHTYSGFEHKVAESLRTRSEAFGFSGKIGTLLVGGP